MRVSKALTARCICLVLMALWISGCTAIQEQALVNTGGVTVFDFGADRRPITGQLQSFYFRFLDKHYIAHGWPSTSACKYGLISADDPDRNAAGWMGRAFVFPFYEKDGVIWQERSAPYPTYNANHLFRSSIQRIPVFEDPDGASARKRVVRYEDRDDGFRALCYETWVPLRMGMVVRLHERTVTEWVDKLRAENPGLPLSTSSETIGPNVWTLVSFPLRPAKTGVYGGPYQYYILPIGDSRYTLLFRLAATEESLQDPMGFAALGAVFRSMLESVRVEPWSEATRAEYAALRQAAEAKVLRDCRARQQKSEELSARCVVVLGR